MFAPDSTVSPTPDPCKIRGVLWIDSNKNLLIDDGEARLPNVPVQLVRNGQVVRTTISDALGNYAFNGLECAEYEVKAQLKSDAVRPFGALATDDTWKIEVVAQTRAKTIEMPAVGDARIRGAAFSRTTGTEVPGGRVTCIWEGLDGVAQTSDDATFTKYADESGSFLIEGAPKGNYDCGLDGQRTRQVKVESKGEAQVFVPAITQSDNTESVNSNCCCDSTFNLLLGLVLGIIITLLLVLIALVIYLIMRRNRDECYRRRNRRRYWEG